MSENTIIYYLFFFKFIYCFIYFNKQQIKYK